MAETKPKVNDLIFKELIKRGYSLEGNTRIWNIADSKLWYLKPDQAQAYLDFENSDGYEKGTSNSEYELLDDSVKDLLEEIKDSPVNMVDLGCGDGKKAVFLLKEFKEKLGDSLRIRYCPIDISGYMVEKAIKNVSEFDVEEIIESQYNISDFENLENITPLLRKGEFKRSLFLLLGYTLGNFEINDLLYQIRSSMKGDDVLLIVSGIGHQRWDEWADEMKNNDLVDNFFSKIPLQLGLKQSDMTFGARFKNHRVEYYYTINKEKEIVFQSRKVKFNEGDEIIVAVAYKHDKGDLLSFLNIYFDSVSLKKSKDGSTALAICKK